MFYLDARNLNEFVEALNNYRKVWKHRPLTLTSAEDRERLANVLDAELSPENLTGDGEFPRGLVQERYNRLTRICKELVKLDPSIKFYEFDLEA